MRHTRELWIGGYGPEDSAHGRGLATFRDSVESRTNGEITVRVTWNIMDLARPNTDLFDLVESGEMFLCYFSSSYLGGRVPELNVLETPFLFESLEHAHRALDGELGSKLREAVVASTGFEVLGFWDNGFRHLTNRLRPVRSPDECRGMTIRVQPNAIHEELFRSWGTRPVAVGLNEGIRLISEGEVDAQENPLANTAAYGVDGVHSFATMTGHLYGARVLLAHRETVEAFPSELQDAIRQGAGRAIAVQREEAADLELRLRTRMEGQGIEFVDLDDDGRSKFKARSAPAIEMAHAGVLNELFELAQA